MDGKRTVGHCGPSRRRGVDFAGSAKASGSSMDSGHGLTSNSAKVDRVGEVPCTARLFSTYHKFVPVCLPLGGFPRVILEFPEIRCLFELLICEKDSKMLLQNPTEPLYPLMRAGSWRSYQHGTVWLVLS